MSKLLALNPFQNIVGFQWDAFNLNKNLLKHGVSWQEAEATYRNKPIIVLKDLIHSDKENRYTLYGQTDRGRKLTIIFTIRDNHFRIISARDQSKKERKIYDKSNKK